MSEDQPLPGSARDAVARLHAALSAHGPDVVLDREVIGEDRITTAWQRLLGVSRLRLVDATVGVPRGDGSFTITGSADLPRAAGVAVEVDVLAAAEQEVPGSEPEERLHVVLRARADTAWAPLDLGGAPPAAVDASTGAALGSPLDGVDLATGALVLSSLDAGLVVRSDELDMERLALDGEAVPAGLLLHSRLPLTGPLWDVVRQLVPVGAHADVAVAVRADEEGRWLTLRLDLAATWPLADHLGVDLSSVTVISGLDADGPPPRVRLDGHLTIGEPIAVAVDVDIGARAVRLRAGSAHASGGGGLTVTDLLAALGLDGPAALGVPDGLSGVGLTGLTVDVDLQPHQVRRLTVAVATEEAVEVIEGILSLEPSMVIDSHAPFSGDAVTDVTLHGAWAIGPAALDLRWRPSRGEVRASLRPGEPLPLEDLLTALGIDDPPDLTVGLDHIGVVARGGSAALEVRVEAAEAIRLALGPADLVVGNVRFVLTRPDRTAPFEWSFAGSLDVAGVHLQVGASRTGGSDWLLDARGAVDTDLDLAGLVRHLLEQVGASTDPWPRGLPEPHASIGLREIVVHHDTREPVTQVYADVDLDVELIHGLTFTHLTTGFELDADGLVEAWLAAGLDVGGVEVALESRWDDERGLQLHGTTGPGQAIPIGAALTSLAALVSGAVADDVPAALEGMTVSDLDVTYRVQTRDLLLHLRGDMPGLDGVTAQVEVALTHAVVDGTASYTRHVRAELDVAALRLDAELTVRGSTSLVIASAVLTPPVSLGLADVVAGIDPGLVAHAPDADLDVRAIMLLQVREDGVARTMLGLAVDVGLDLAGLPLVGPALGVPVGVGLQPLLATAAFTAADIASLDGVLAHGPIALPADGVGAGLGVETELRLGEDRWRLSLPVGLDDGGGAVPAPSPPSTPAAPAAEADGLRWFDVARTLGPAHLSRIGVGFDDGILTAAVDGSIRLGPLTLELMGLRATTPIDRLEPTFDLHGLGLDYRAGEIEIGGALLRTTDASGEDTYAGKIVVRTPQLSLSALGLYGAHHGHPALFVYAVVTAPLGGPAFFFVTGVALGFGYNRALLVPAIDDVATFPLVQEAMGTTGPPPSLEAELTRLRDAIPARTGAMFLAAGIRFSTFEVLDSFLLLVVQIGERVEIDLLGLTRAVLPPAVDGEVAPPLAVLELAIAARFLPAEGTLLVRGQLTPASYVLSPACRLSGGFAVAAWMGERHTGDFVMTLGGYHPHFRRPSHYPTVPRLELTWQVDPHLRVHGDLYAAMTPTTMMAGAHVQATWHSGSMRAWFAAGIDLLLSWKPFHYEASLTVHIGGSYTYHFFGTHHLSVSLSAELEIWGPPFAGRASLDLAIVSVTVRFGPQGTPAPRPLSWWAFAASFLPSATDVCTLSVTDGLIAEVDGAARATVVVDATHLRLRVASRVPQGGRAGGAAIGVGPMGLPAGQLYAPLTITVTDEDAVDVTALFDITDVREAVPAAMWGGAVRPGLNDARLVPGAVVAQQLVPRDTTPPAHTAAMSPEAFSFETHLHPLAGDDVGDPDPPLRVFPTADGLQGDLVDGRAAARRRRLLDSARLPFTPDDVPLAGLVWRLHDTPSALLDPALHEIA